MNTAKEMMHKETPVLTFNATVPEAVTYFAQNKLEFAAVQASPDRFHGVITEGSLMRIYLRYKSHPERESLILYRDLFEPAQLVHQNEPFGEVVRKIVTAVGHRVFVINDTSAVIGYIKARDILPILSGAGTGSAAENQAHPELLRNQSELYLYENFFTQSPFLMHSINRKGEIQMANEILHRVLGYEYGELLGKTVIDLYPKNVQQKVKESLIQIIDKGFHKVVKGQMLHKNGNVVEVEMVSRALLDQAGETIGTVTVSRPVDMKYLLDCLPHT